MNAYAGSLTAMLSKPKLETPIKTLDELLSQNKISWVLEKGTPLEYYMQTASPGTTMKLLHQRAVMVPHLTPEEAFKFGCYAAKLKGKGRFGSFCDLNVIWHMLAKDFSTTGRCNFYLIEDRFKSSMQGAAFQVSEYSASIKDSFSVVTFIGLNSRWEVRIWKTSIFSLILKTRWGWNFHKME